MQLRVEMSQETVHWLSGQNIERLDPRSVDAVFDVLSNEYRRLAITYLGQTGGPASVEDVIDEVAHQTSNFAGPEPTRERLAALFYHVHLPKMADAGVIDYDRERETITIPPDQEASLWITD